MFIVVMAFLIFLGLSTFVPDSSIVGVYGSKIGYLNYDMFGYLAYIYPFLLIVPSFFIYRDSTFDNRRVEFI